MIVAARGMCRDRNGCQRIEARSRSDRIRGARPDAAAVQASAGHICEISRAQDVWRCHMRSCAVKIYTR